MSGDIENDSVLDYLVFKEFVHRDGRIDVDTSHVGRAVSWGTAPFPTYQDGHYLC
jgi:hypothetical protein